MTEEEQTMFTILKNNPECRLSNEEALREFYLLMYGINIPKLDGVMKIQTVLRMIMTLKELYPAELTDAWSGGQWGNGKFEGCDFDINVMDRDEFGGPDDGAGLFASIYGCHLEDGEPHVNMDDGIDDVPVTCWFEDKNGKRTEFKCDEQENFLELFGEWDCKAVAPKAKEKEMKVTCELTFKASLVTTATTEKEAKEEAIKALAEAYRARGIDGII
jgi:hypothetical protein